MSETQGMNISRSQDKFEIGIVTYCRWESLRFTLQRIGAFGWNDVPVQVIDDGSVAPPPPGFPWGEVNATLYRRPERKGYIVRRNELAQMMTAPYYLSLDDDSFPVQGDLNPALTWLESNPSALATGFAVKGADEKWQIICRAEPAPTQSFIGCAHLLNRANFLALGGYDEALVHQGEETDLAAEGFKRGWGCYHLPDLIIRHEYSLVARSWSRMAYYGGRNKIVWLRKHAPTPARYVKICRAVMERIILAIKDKKFAHLSGAYDGICAPRHIFKKSRPMSAKQYGDWKALPTM